MGRRKLIVVEIIGEEKVEGWPRASSFSTNAFSGTNHKPE
jgi:hypothetical protein